MSIFLVGFFFLWWLRWCQVVLINCFSYSRIWTNRDKRVTNNIPKKKGHLFCTLICVQLQVGGTAYEIFFACIPWYYYYYYYYFPWFVRSHGIIWLYITYCSNRSPATEATNDLQDSERSYIATPENVVLSADLKTEDSLRRGSAGVAGSMKLLKSYQSMHVPYTQVSMSIYLQQYFDNFFSHFILWATLRIWQMIFSPLNHSRMHHLWQKTCMKNGSRLWKPLATHL